MFDLLMVEARGAGSFLGGCPCEDPDVALQSTSACSCTVAQQNHGALKNNTTLLHQICRRLSALLTLPV